MENNKLKVKDLVNIGIFSALYMAIAMVVMIPVGIAPILWLLWPGIAGLFGGVFFTLLLTKVPKMGASLLLALISGILFFATGECTWVIIVTFAIAGLLAEVMRKVLGYKSFKGIALAGGFCAIGFIGSPLPMWLFQESYMKSIEEMGMGAKYVEGLQSMISAGSFIGMLAVAFIGGLLGTLIGHKMLKKHFEKAGMVRSVDIARHMNVSKPSVCHAVGILREGGFLTMDEEHYLHLTDIGREVAEIIYERHCFFTEQLIAAGVDPKIAEADACRIEHVISSESFERLKEAAVQE